MRKKLRLGVMFVASITLVMGLAGALRAAVLPRTTIIVAMSSVGGDAAWDAMHARLVQFKAEWGNADAPLGQGAEGELGRWCKVQRRLRADGKLTASRTTALDALDFSWLAPSDIDDPLSQCDWSDMCMRLRAYRAEHGDCDVKKKDLVRDSVWSA